MALLTLTPGVTDLPATDGALVPATGSADGKAPAGSATESTEAPATPATPSKGGTRRVLGVLLNAGGTILVIAALVVFLFLAVGPRFLGYQTATMLTGSMAPSIVPGDIVVTTQQPVADVEVGDVISYHIPVEDHRVETHRVIEVLTNPDGTTAVRTQGDANEAADPWIATLDGDHVYQEAFVIPEIGNLIRALRTPAVSTVLVYGAPTVLVLGLLTMIWSRPGTEDTAEDTADDTAAHAAGTTAAGAAGTTAAEDIAHVATGRAVP